MPLSLEIADWEAPALLLVPDFEAGTAFFLDPSSGSSGVVASALIPGAGVAFDSEPFSPGEPSVACTTAGVDVCEGGDFDGIASL